MCSFSSDDSSLAFLTSKLHIWEHEIFQGLTNTAFKSLPTYLRMEALLCNHHLLGYCFLHHILQIYHSLYSKDARDYLIERPEQQFYNDSKQSPNKLSIQEYYDAYTCYLYLNAYINASSVTLATPTELRIFIQRFIQDKELYQATHYDCDTNDLKYKFLLHSIAKTLQVESSQLPYICRPFDRFSDSSSDDSFFLDSYQPNDQSQRNETRTYT